MKDTSCCSCGLNIRSHFHATITVWFDELPTGVVYSVAVDEKTYFVPSVSQIVKRLSLPYSIFTPL